MSDEDVNDELAKIFENGLRLQSDKNISIFAELPPNLSELQSPFTWKFDHKCDVRDIVDRIEGKIDEMDDDDEEIIPWKSFVLNLILCYEHSKNGNLEDAEEKLIILEEILDKCDDEGRSSGPVMGLGLRHISLACRCFLLHASQLYDEVDRALATIVPFHDLGAKDKASILCMKGAYFAEFGYQGIRDSVDMFEGALKIDKECGVGYFLLGRSLSRLRRLEKRSAIPDERELRALERAVAISKYVSFMVLLAQSYRETARNLYIAKRKDLKSFGAFCDSLNQKSLGLYKKVLEQGKINVHVLTRCGLGFMKIPKPWKDLENAKTCIIRALEIAPQNPMVNHVAGQYYTMVRDHKQAMEYLSKACTYGVFGAEIDLIVLKKKNIESYDAAADIERLLDVYKEKPHQESILCLLGSYYYFSKNNFKKGFTYWLQVIELDITSEKLKVFYDSIGAERAVKINKIIITEIMKFLNAGDVSDSERVLYDQIITKYIKHHPGLIVSATDIDVSLYRRKEFEYKSWKNRYTDKKYVSGNSVPSLSVKTNKPSDRNQCRASSSNETLLLKTGGQGSSCSVPSTLPDEAKGRDGAISSASAGASITARAGAGGRAVRGSHGRGRGHGGARGRGQGADNDRNDGSTGPPSMRMEVQPKPGSHRGHTGAVKKNFHHGAKSSTSSWRSGSQ